MTALWIIGGLAVLFAILLTAPVKIGVSYCDDLQVVAKYLFLKLTLWSSEDKKEKKQKKQKTKKQKSREDKPQKEKKQRPPLRLLAETVLDILKKLFLKLKKHLRLEKATARITVGHEDPAKAALLYGGISSATGNLFVFLQGIKNRSKKKKTIDFEIKPDFLAEKTYAFLELELSARLFWWLSIGATAGAGLLELKKLFSTDEKQQKTSTERTNDDEQRNAIETDH